MRAGLPTGTVTFLFSDIEGSTDLSRQYGVAYGDLRAEHRRLLREAFAAHDGSVIDAEGDAFFVVFDRAADAVAAAVAAQRSLEGMEAVRVRIGIHTTEPHLHSEGYIGVGVSRAARMGAAAHGGQIVLSHTAAGIVEDQNLVDLRLKDLGEHRLKDISQPQRLFQVEAKGSERAVRHTTREGQSMDIPDVIEQSHSAWDAFAIGDPAPIKALYARGDDVLLANPYGGAARGWPAVSQTLDLAASNFRDGERVRFEEVARYSSADLVTLFEQEHWETKVGARNELSPFDLRVTTTFRLESGEWKIVSRHADNLTTPHPDGPLRPTG